MQDPKVLELTKALTEQVKVLNETWLQLQNNDVYVNMMVSGGYAKGSTQYLELKQVTQSVEYKVNEKH